MAMVCPQCRNLFDKQVVCPTCNVRLEYSSDTRKRTPADFVLETAPPPEPAWQQAPWIRMVVGILLVQGMYFGLLQAALAVTSTVYLYESLQGLLIRQAFQVPVLLLGGLLVGASQRRGMLYGAGVGLVNGLLFVLVDLFTAKSSSLPELLYAQPILQTAVGALAGYLGRAIWKPLPILARSRPRTETPPAPTLVKPRPKEVPAPPVIWWRTVAGVALAVGGSLWASVIFNFIVAASEGKLSDGSRLQQQFITWEIAVLATFAGAAFAGATTGAGLKHGLLVAAGAGAFLCGIHLAGRSDPAHAQLFEMLNVSLFNLPNAVQVVVFTVFSTFILGMLGGWFGDQLLPPMNPRRRAHIPTI